MMLAHQHWFPELESHHKQTGSLEIAANFSPSLLAFLLFSFFERFVD